MTLLIIIIALALIFDFINGFHDAANSIATIVSTKVLTPFQAVVWAAFFNLLAFWLFELNIADTISKTVKTDAIDLWVVLAGLLGAVFWNLLTWWYGIPSSSSHTLIGGFAGAAIAHAGFGIVNTSVIIKVTIFIVLAPVIGMLLSFIITALIQWLCRNFHPGKAEIWFKRGQLVSSALFSLGHGGNDAQKVMGLIGAAVLVYLNTHNLHIDDVPAWLHVTMNEVAGKKKLHLPEWIPLACYSAIALGTMSGGWRIVKTMGTKITKVTPIEGVAAETAGAAMLFMADALKVPVSTTHTITGSIIGVGLAKRTSAVRWGVTVNLLWAWILTIPVSALVGAIAYFVFKLFV
ncbi:MAG: inorganic phosphate transporter [Saprospiraceae bacterium]|jgi:PiT family inorganic phosphate transporter|nr:inorganic phosphate transporter [Saprospiraceae bacterium]